MSKADFAKTIIKKLKDSIGTDGQKYKSSSATSAMAAVAEGITDYLKENTKVMISYTGVIPGVPPVTDPVVADTLKITGACAPPSASNSFETWLLAIQTNIVAGFVLDPEGGEAGVIFPTVPFLAPGVTTTQANLKSAHKVDDTDPQQKIWEIVCGGIMDWINGSAMNTVPGAATNSNSGSAGMGTITKIIIT